ncbi:hypothetical protein [Aeromonas sp. MdU4]|uniref:ribonuclease T2 family protein n=1 Tax=Aeromonas sp. MdU4 TaxID=3342819 RepID=UPI0035BA6093
MHKSLLAISSILLLGASSYAVRAADLFPQGEHTNFDTYVLALSWQPGFCQSKGYSPAECPNLRNGEGELDALTIHGLWPSLPESLNISVGNWHKKGCNAVYNPQTERNYPSATKPWCNSKPVDMSPAFHQGLVKYMPGIKEPTCLHQYEYAKHGVCFGFKPEDYFGAMISLNRDLRNSPVGKFMKDNYGEEVNTADFKQVIVDTYGEDVSRNAVQLICTPTKKGLALTEIRLALRASEINTTLAYTSFNTDQSEVSGGSSNCGKSFTLIKYREDNKSQRVD